MNVSAIAMFSLGPFGRAGHSALFKQLILNLHALSFRTKHRFAIKTQVKQGAEQQ